MRLQDSQETENLRGRGDLSQPPNEGVQTFHSAGEEQRSLSHAITPGSGKIRKGYARAV